MNDTATTNDPAAPAMPDDIDAGKTPKMYADKVNVWYADKHAISHRADAFAKLVADQFGA